jgi:hypothetical protein
MRRAFVTRAVSPAVLASVLASAPAWGMDTEVTTDTTAQFYEVRSPSGQTILARRRLTTTLGAAAYDILPRPKEAGQELLPDLSVRIRLRYDADYGAAAEEADPTSPARWVPGFQRGPVDLMYGYVEGRRFLKGTLGFKLGRQYIADSLGWWSFDGGLVRVTTPVWVVVEGYGGFEVRGGMPLSPSADRWSRGGVWRGDRSKVDPALWPSFQPVDLAPAFGVGVETQGVHWVHGRLSYRRVYNTGPSNTSQFASATSAPVGYDGMRVSQERLGYSLMASHPNVGALQGGLQYDFYANRFTNLYAGAEVYTGKHLTLGADYDYWRPSFDADSIFNFFGTEPTHTLAARADVDLGKLQLAGSSLLRAYHTEANPAYGSTAVGTYAGGFTLSGRYRTGAMSIGARSDVQAGDGGRRGGADLFGERTFGDHYVVSGRVGGWEWKDTLRPERSAFNFGYVLGLGYKFFRNSQAMVEWQHDANRFAGQRFRVMFWLALAVVR